MKILIPIHDPADRLDLSYIFANNYASLGVSPSALVEMAGVARNVVPGVSCRAVLVHPGEIVELVKLLKGSTVRPEVVVDFPDGLGGIATKEVQAQRAAAAGAVGGDPVVNLHAVQMRDRKTVFEEIRVVCQHLHDVKVIVQLPYLWQFDKEAIPWLLEIIAEAGAYCVKDWTTRVDNFLLPEGAALDYTHETRLRYIDYVAEYVAKHNLPLIQKIAGRVVASEVQSFIDAGALLVGTSYRKAASLRSALLLAK